MWFLKGEALQQVAALQGYQVHDCIAFGDGMNDKEMLTLSGKVALWKMLTRCLKMNYLNLRSLALMPMMR